MKDETRLANLRLLVHEHCSRAAVAKEIGITPAEIVRYFDNKHLSVPDQIARKIENVFEKPKGWMDRENYDLKLNESEWELLKKFRETSDQNKKIVIAVLNAIQTTESSS
ncbi:hypothetical protein [Pseudomonas sp. CC6-YY-74]|uniref:hypothetical protein n=1 Tax=Pseudomonas sp. CC6-YY-74 TaxID=1930532 RepID=UPI0012AC16A5|nr:hypothetical protein [Pseudomonas sp. CC6-YY-74]